MKPIINIENLSKQYRLGEVGTGTFSHDINRWWHKVRGKEDPYLQIGEVNDRATKGSSDYVWALKDINIQVMPGEVLGIIGKNGAGKSTLLKLLSRVTAPTTGIIEARGRMASLLEVGTGFHPELTGRENVFLNGAILGMAKSEIRAKLDEIVDFAGCERYIDTPVKRYSSGMKVRLAFAVAAHLEPDILIVDEVLAVGDAEFQAKAIGKMQEVSLGEGRTVLFVSHNMASIQALCTRAVILKNGTIKATGSVQNIIDNYLTSSSSGSNESYKFGEDNHQKEVWIDTAYFEKGGNVVKNAISGQDLEIVVNYKARYTGQKCSILIGIYNNYGDKILHLGSIYGGFDSFLTKTGGTIKCTIPGMPLVEGSYVLNIALQKNGRTYHKVDGALHLNVESGDFFGNGKLPNPKDSKLLVRQNWTVA